MNKKLLFAATVAAMLASCSSDNLSVQTAAKQEAQGLENAVSFEALSQRSLTRAGYAGAMDNAKLQEEGFGVFGYYTDLNEYDQTSTPNFMYNQKVSGAGWTYEPVKYWPNEYGNTAASDDVDKLTFFAYAPYTENTPSTGKVTEDQVGITGFTRNTAAGDPYVKYIASLDPSKCVDLCWGVANPSADVTWDIIQGGSQTIDKGMPWMNVQRPQKSLGQKMKFFFKHALSQLNVQIDADVNTDTHGAGAEVDAKSKVYVRSVTFSGFAMKGALNLNNEEAGVPNWKGYGCNCEPLPTEEYTIYDGMKDGKEGTGYVASNEKVTGLNPTIIQSKKWAESAEGVTKTAKNLFNNTGRNPQATDPIYVIPTGDDLSVTIVYDIETEDEKLAGTVSDNETPGVSIENKISKTITIDNSALTLEAGKKYTVNLHLGLSQVEFDAEVEDWDDAESAEANPWLPNNVAMDFAVHNINDVAINQALAPTAGVTLKGVIQPSDVADQNVLWSLTGANASYARLSATVGASTTVTPVDNFVGPVTLNAYNPGTQKTATVTVYCTHASSALVDADLGRVVGTDDNIYLTKNDAETYAEIEGTTGIAMVSDVTNKLAYALIDYSSFQLADCWQNIWPYVNWDVATAVTSDQFNTFYGTTGKTWRLPTVIDMQHMFQAVGQNGWSNVYRVPKGDEIVIDDNEIVVGVNGTETDGPCNHTFAPMATDGLGDTWNAAIHNGDAVDSSREYFDATAIFLGTTETNSNRMVSYGKFCKAIVDCGGTHMINTAGYWFSEELYGSGMAWFYVFYSSDFWTDFKSNPGIVRPVLAL